MRRVKLLPVILAAVLAFPFLAAAQSVASLTGVVTDSSGAAVPGASIKVTNTQTGASLFGKTAGDGSYRISDVPPGPGYSLTVRKDGFETAIVNNLYLSVGPPVTQDVQLQLGTITQSVEVTAPGGAGSLDTTDATIGTVVEGNRVQDLPSLFVNNASLFLELAPGVQSTGNDSQTGVVTGTRADQTNITLDGLDVNDERIGEAFAPVVNTPLDSIQEISTIVGGSDASYGHSAGAQVELVTKSGTNQFHGEAFDFNRVTALAANNYFNNLEGIGIPKLIRNQFGGDIGGPILKNKLFFFFSYNGLRSTQSQEINDVVPLAALRNGQLNYINNGGTCDGSSNIVSTPSCISTTPASGPGSLAALDPQGVGADAALLSFFTARGYPAANNFSAGDLVNTAGFLFAAPVQDRDNTFVGKLDWQVNSQHTLFARGTWDRSNDDDSVNFQVKVFPQDSGAIASIVDHSRSWVVGDTWVISPSMVNKLSFGETDQYLVFPLASKPNFPNLLDFFFNGNVIQAPYDDTAGGNSTFNEQFPIVPVYQLRDAFTWTRGNHTLQFGGVFKPTIYKSGNLTDYNSYSVGLGGLINSLGAPGSPLRPSDINSDSVALGEWDALFPLALGRIATISSGFNYNLAGDPLPQGTIPVRDYHATEYEFYAQDVWTIRSALTVTYGLRWQFHNPLAEIHGFEAVPNISPEKIFAIRQADALAGIEGPDAVPVITYSLGGPHNNGPGYYKPSHTNFAPRIGLAYSPFGGDSFFGRLLGNRKTSIRAGFSLNYDDNLIGQGFELDETSFLFSNSTTQNNGSLLTDPRFSGFDSLPPAAAAEPTPRPFTPNLDDNGVPVGFNEGGFGANGPFFNFDPNYKTPYEISFSLGIQRELPHDWLVDVSYFGKVAHRLPAIGDVGQTLNFKDATSGQFLYDAFGKVQASLQATGGDFTAVPNQPWFENQMTMAVNAAGIPDCPTALAVIGSEYGVPLPSVSSCTQMAAFLEDGYWSNGDVSSTLVGLAELQPDFNPEHGLIPLNAGQLAQDGAAGYIGNYGSSSYNALLVRVNHRMSHDFTMEFDYAFSHSLDNDSDIQNNLVTFTGTGEAEICDLRDLHVCRSNSNFDATHTFASNFTYGLPFGQGKWIGAGASKALNELIGGWSVSGIIIARTGFPFSVDSGTFPIDFTQTAPAVFVGTRSDLKAGVHLVPTGGTPEVEYFSNLDNAQNAFEFPFGGGTGNRNQVRGPGFWNVDFAILKNFTMPWSDSHKLEFRAEAFNLFNHTDFNPPSASILFPGNFGSLSSTANNPRQFQLALRYSF